MQSLRDQQLEYDRVYQVMRQIAATHGHEDVPSNPPERQLRTGLAQTRVGSVSTLMFYDAVSP